MIVMSDFTRDAYLIVISSKGTIKKYIYKYRGKRIHRIHISPHGLAFLFRFNIIFELK